jgi:wyosine [tRNA(Phe)-imidazoG37] synthetase (radical SAM superfamily)
MEPIHSKTGEVLIPISRLIDPAKRTERPPPLHTQSLAPRTSKERQVELSPLHDFMAKLRQPGVFERLRGYVRWQSEWRHGYAQGMTLEEALKTAPEDGPLSINLDITTACNYRCDHCVDLDILNTGIRFDHDKLCDSLTELARRGLRSVIVIGGGEPTAYAKFEDIIRHLKTLDQHVGIVTNGGMMQKIHRVADVLTKRDWVRLSLDSGTNDTFVRMHKPGSSKVTLDWICEHIPPIKAANPDFRIGYSFIIVWNDCEANDFKIIENIDEIFIAAARAKRHGFDYISYKPFLTRAKETNNAEIVDLAQRTDEISGVMKRIRRELERAKELEDTSFKVVESTNLRVFENGSYLDYTDQPKTCHMQFFRQVLSPLGVFNCPVYRHVPQALLGGKHSYSTIDSALDAQRNTLRLIEAFDASEECKSVTCLYNHANWFIEDLINHPEKLDQLEPSEDRLDYFL